MYRYHLNKKLLVWLTCLGFIFLVGCEGKPEAPAKAKGVRQKIAVPQQQQEPAKTAAQDAVDKGTPVATPESGMGTNATVAAVTPPKEAPGLLEAHTKDEIDVKPGGKDGLYQPEGRIDPFAPLFQEEPRIAAAGEKSEKDQMPVVPITPLTRVDLSQLKLTGVILAESGSKALVEEASGKGYIVKEGMYIGNKAGTVVKIVKDTIIVDEKYIDVLGKLKTQQRELQLQKPPGEF